MKYIVYCRKSSEQEERQIQSIEGQRHALEALIKEKNLDATFLEPESGSAHKTGRPIFNKLLTLIKTGQYQGLIVWDETRIARNALDGGQIIDLIDKGKLLEIITPSRKYTNNADDKAWLGFTLIFSKKDSDDKGVNVKRGLRTKADNGWYPHSWAKPGYMWDKYAEKGNKTLLKRPGAFELIQKGLKDVAYQRLTPMEAFKQINDGGYKSQLKKKFGGKPLQRSTFYTMLRDPFFCGIYFYPNEKGELIEKVGKHEPMIIKDEFERIQVILGGNGNKRMQKHSHLFAGMMKCGECGSSIVGDEKWQIICSHCKTKFAKSKDRIACPKCQTPIEDMRQPKLLHYIYYRCTKKKTHINCKQKAIEEKQLDEEIDCLLGKINISNHFKEWAIKHLNEINTDEEIQREKLLSTLQLNLKQCSDRINNLVRLKISAENIENDLLSDEEFKFQKENISGERKRIENELKNLGQRTDLWIETAENAFNFACRAREQFQHGDTAMKRDILFSLGSNLNLMDKKVRIDLLKPFSFIENVKNDEVLEKSIVEPRESLVLSMDFASLWNQNPSLLPD